MTWSLVGLIVLKFKTSTLFGIGLVYVQKYGTNILSLVDYLKQGTLLKRSKNAYVS